MALAVLDLILLQPALEQGEAYYVYAAAQSQLIHSVRLMRFDRFDADVQMRGDLFIAVAPGYLSEDIFFAGA